MRHPGLQRRIFLWFGATILFTAAIVGTLFWILAPTETFQRDAAGLQSFVSGRLVPLWDRPTERDGFVHDLHRDLRMGAMLTDLDGRILSQAGPSCERPMAVMEVMGARGVLGSLRICPPPHRGHGPRFAVILITILMILWGAAGILARRLVGPVRQLASMAREIGEGNLDVRSNLSPRRAGELGVLGQTMNEMVSRIAKQRADQAELLAAVSHELRTPLGHLRLLLEMAQESAENTGAEDAGEEVAGAPDVAAAGAPPSALLTEMEREVLEVDELVGQLLASSRLEFGVGDRQETDPIEAAERALSRLNLPLERLEVEGKVPEISADPTLLSRALTNLLRNAEDHGKGMSRLLIRFEPGEEAEETAPMVVFSIEDEGPGFSVEERERVFESFYRGEHRAGASLGLGLSLVRRIAQAHGGRAWVEPIEQGGSRVSISMLAG